MIITWSIGDLNLTAEKQAWALKDAANPPVKDTPFILNLYWFKKWVDKDVLGRIDSRLSVDLMMQCRDKVDATVNGPFLDNLLLKAANAFFSMSGFTSGYSAIDYLQEMAANATPLQVKEWEESMAPKRVQDVHLMRQTLQTMAPWALGNIYKDYSYAAMSGGFYKEFTEGLKDSINQNGGDTDEFEFTRVFRKSQEKVCGNIFEDEYPTLKYPPRTYQDALKSQDRKKWIQAMDLEETNLRRVNVYEEVPRESYHGHKLNAEWEFINKGSLGFQARVKVFGAAASESSPTCSLASVRLLLTLGPSLGIPLSVISCNNALLQTPIKGRVYVNPPHGIHNRKAVVWKLRGQMYGLKSASARMYENLSRILTKHGLKKSAREPCLFYKKDCFVLVYADQLLVCTEDSAQISKWLSGNGVDSSVNSSPKNFLGISIDPPILSMRENIDKMQAKYGIGNLTATLPFDFLPSSDVYPLEGKEARRFRSLLGSLQYIGRAARPDVIGPLADVAADSEFPNVTHLHKLHRIAQYLVSTRTLGLGAVGIRKQTLKGGRNPGTLGIQLLTASSKARTSYIVLLNERVIDFGSSEFSSGSKDWAGMVAISDGLTPAFRFKDILEELDVGYGGIELFTDSETAAKQVYYGTNTPLPPDENVLHICTSALIRGDFVKVSIIDSAENPAHMMLCNSKAKYIDWVKKVMETA